MTITVTTPIDLSTSAYVTNAAGTIILTAGPAVTNTNYNDGVVPSFTNFGTLDSTNTTGGAAGASGIFLQLGSSSVTAQIGNAGLITGYDYGIYAKAVGVNGQGAINFNNMSGGTIIARDSSASNFGNAAGIFVNDGSMVTVNNSGLIEGAEGVFLRVNDAATQVVDNNAGATIIGTTDEGTGLNTIYGIKIQDNNSGLQGTGIINNAGLVMGLVDVAANYAFITNASTGTIGSGVFALGTGTLALEAGGSFAGGAQFADGRDNGLTLALATLLLGGTPGAVGDLANPAAYIGFGSVTVQTGADWTVGSLGGTAGFSSVTTISDFGTLNIAGSLTGNTIDMEGSIPGTASQVDFTGTNTATRIVDYGTGDAIVIATLGGAGDNFKDSYNTSNGVLTVTEYDSVGNSIGSAMVTVSGAPGVTIATGGSFVELSGTGGDTIVLGNTTLSSASGSIYIDNGEAVTLNNTAGFDTIPVTFGTHGTLGAFNTLDLNGTVTGTTSPYQGAISGFGLNDDIVLGPSVLPSVASGDSVTLSYTGSLLTVTELNSSGVSIGATTLDVGTGYAAGSFVALLGTDGVNIEAPQTVLEQTFTFGPEGAGTAYQGDFEDPTQYQGGLAPGSTIIAGETVVVADPGQANLNSSLTNDGLIVLDADNENMVANSPISGTGTIQVAGGSMLTLDNTSGTTTNTISFGGGDSFLTLAGTGTASFGGVIAGMGAHDTIDLTSSFLPTPGSASNIRLSFSPGSDVLTISDTVNGTLHTDTLTFSGAVPGTFSAALGSNGIVITDVPCFATGTRLLTPDGQVAVERLAVGDAVLTARDGSAQHIVWVGSRTVDLARHAIPEKVIPVVILAGAFGDGLPERDLKLSPDHALFIDGHLVEAKTLVNGTTVIRDHSIRHVTYHHIELERHDVVLAEGLAAETYLDSGNRQNFSADAAPLVLHPDFAAGNRANACAMLLQDGAIVRAARATLLARAEALGFTKTDAIDLMVKAGVERIAALADGAAHELMFLLPSGTREIELISATGVPAEISADPTDRRALGAAVTGMALIAGGQRIEIALDDPAHQGFYALEGGHRWTNGHARIALPAYSGRAVLEVTLHGQAARWQVPLSVTA